MMYILPITTSLIIHSAKTRILYKNKMAKATKDLLEGETGFIVDLTGLS